MMDQNQAQEIQISEELIECEHRELIHNALCKICFMLLQRPILMCTNCGYFACRGCIKRWQRNTQNQNCPQKCSPNSTFLEKSIPQLDKVFKWLSIKCPNSQNEDPAQRCNIVMKYDQVQGHVPNCDYTLVKCKYANCQVHICKKDQESHHKICEFNKTKCKFCLIFMKVEDLEKHQSECDLRIVNCPNNGCNSRVQYIKRSVHMDQCKFRIVECGLCRAQMQAQKIDEHSKNECTFRQIACSQCNDPILKKDEHQHQKQQCLMREVCCENCLQGIKFKDLQNHSEDDCIKSLNERLNSAQAEKDSCMQQIQEISQYLNQNQNKQ